MEAQIGHTETASMLLFRSFFPESNNGKRMLCSSVSLMWWRYRCPQIRIWIVIHIPIWFRFLFRFWFRFPIPKPNTNPNLKLNVYLNPNPNPTSNSNPNPSSGWWKRLTCLTRSATTVSSAIRPWFCSWTRRIFSPRKFERWVRGRNGVLRTALNYEKDILVGPDLRSLQELFWALIGYMWLIDIQVWICMREIAIFTGKYVKFTPNYNGIRLVVNHYPVLIAVCLKLCILRRRTVDVFPCGVLQLYVATV